MGTSASVQPRFPRTSSAGLTVELLLMLFCQMYNISCSSSSSIPSFHDEIMVHLQILNNVLALLGMAL